jgi:hypothetical protein
MGFSSDCGAETSSSWRGVYGGGAESGASRVKYPGGETCSTRVPCEIFELLPADDRFPYSNHLDDSEEPRTRSIQGNGHDTFDGRNVGAMGVLRWVVEVDVLGGGGLERNALAEAVASR